MLVNKNIFKNLFLIILFVVTLACALPLKANAISISKEDAEAVVLMDGKTGQILYGKNQNESLAPASTTKILTALLVLENSKIDDMVTIGDNPPNAEGTSIGLQKGDVYSINDLLHGLLLESANDCAIALAEHVGTSVENFAKMMNDRARSLGAINSNFVNPNGLYEKEHKTTAHDLALIMREVAKHPEFVKISREPLYKLPPSKIDNKDKWVNNKNKLVLKNDKYFYNEALTGKTGFTTPSLHTYVAVAEKNDETLILSMLRSPSKDIYFKDAKDLFEYGFNNFTTLKLYEKGDKVCNYEIDKNKEIGLTASEDFYYTFNKNNLANRGNNIDNKPNFVVDKISFDKDTVKIGDIVGEGKILIDGKEIGSLKLCSSVDNSSLKPQIKRIPKNIIILSSLIGISIVLLVGFLIFKKRKKKNLYI